MAELGWEKVLIWECLFVHRKTRILLIRDYESYVEEFDENVDLEEPTSFLDLVY